ncbi:CPBP family intramembrane metalloprotease [Paenibacillus sp. EKM202P]|uniref:CPBP family intramembrane glutamic endopeptidase n=1 Tax=unclassified Paenibacillus TaxID=185978 RepID=UPI0013EC8719|nr:MULTISPECIES: CPBP family intramembrane glutamic endopeptidase [unclassified Paenibacillus]KAF6565337.1 CPBP family intramembrane metalloprotease [Paenibacillus sp. EKM202P]KAF6569337.1 CPBP family intramembrane metalloprotease [Paenibacillus sp. EKM207P]
MQKKEKIGALLEGIVDTFTNNNKVIVLINSIIFVSTPILIILKHRFGIRSTNLLITMSVFSFLFSVWVSKNLYFRLPKSNLNVKNKIMNFLIYYVFFPLSAPVFIAAIVNLIGGMFVKNENPQGLTALASNEVIYSLFTDIIAGAEEIWRYSSIFIIYLIFTFCFRRFSKSKGTKIALLISSFLISSFIFGWLHTFSYSNGWINLDITVTIGLMGLCFSLVMFITKRIWCAILTHSMFDAYTTLKLYNADIVLLILALTYISIATVWICTIIRNTKDKTTINS